MADWSTPKTLSSSGAIRADQLPAAGFQLLWMLEWLLEPMTFGGGAERYRGFWRWQILSPDNVVLFDSHVDIYGTAIWLPGTAGLVAWYIQINSANPKVATSVPQRPPIEGTPSDASSWHQRTDGTWQNDVEQGYIDEEGWEAGAGGYGNNNEFPVYSVWASARYMIPLPEGAKVRLWQGAGGEMFQVPRLLRCQISTLAAGRRFGTLYDDPGFLRLARVRSGLCEQVVSPMIGSSFTRRIPRPLAEPSIAKAPTNELLVCGKFAKVGWIVQTSADDGLTWREVYELAFDASYTDCRMVTARDGAAVAIARKGGELWARSSRDGWVQAARVGPASAAMELTQDRQAGTLIATDGKSLTYVSSDGGRTWRKLTWPTT